MPHRYAVYGCRGTYTRETYCDVVKFPSKNNVEAKKIRYEIHGFPPCHTTRKHLNKKSYTCKKLFNPNCKQIAIQEGKRLDEPQSIIVHETSESKAKRNKIVKHTRATHETKRVSTTK